MIVVACRIFYIEIDHYDDEDDHDFNRTVPNGTKCVHTHTHTRSIRSISILTICVIWRCYRFGLSYTRSVLSMCCAYKCWGRVVTRPVKRRGRAHHLIESRTGYSSGKGVFTLCSACFPVFVYSNPTLLVVIVNFNDGFLCLVYGCFSYNILYVVFK